MIYKEFSTEVRDRYIYIPLIFERVYKLYYKSGSTIFYYREINVGGTGRVQTKSESTPRSIHFSQFLLCPPLYTLTSFGCTGNLALTINIGASMSTQQSPSVFASLGVTLVNLLGTVNTTANLANRAVNTIDQYAQTVERHAIDYNYSSQLVSAKRREQLEQQYKLLSPEQKALLDKEDIFDVVPS